MLATNIITKEDVLGRKRKLITIGSRSVNQIAGMYGTGELPVLQLAQPIAKLYMKEAHEKGHEGTVSTLHRSRKNVWIINGRSLAEATRVSCTECQLKEKKCMGQIMGPLPDHRVGPSPIFQSVAVDLFGPIKYQGTMNKRQVGKGLGCNVCLFGYVSRARGIPYGLATVHVCKGCAIKDSVRQGRAASGRVEATGGLEP